MDYLPLLELRSFLRVAETGTFIRAARELKISQPSLSRHIKALEGRLNTRLFDRDTRRVALSAAGREMLPICRRMLAELERGANEISEIASGHRGRITIAVLPSIAGALLPRALAKFRAINANVDIRLVDGALEDVEAAVIQGHADFGLTAQPERKHHLRFHHLLDDPMLALLRSDDPLAAKKSLTWEELSSRPFIAIKARTSIRRMADLGFAKAGVVVSPAFEVAFVKTAATLVATRLGVTAIPRLYADECVEPCLINLPLQEPEISRKVGIITAVDRSLAASATQLMDLLCEVARTN